MHRGNALDHRGRFSVVTFAVACLLGCLVAMPGLASAATWSIQTTPNAAGAKHSALYDIDCEAGGLKVCLSAGKQTTEAGVSSPYAQAWNGTTWSSLTPNVPAESTASEFQSIDCLSATVCLGAGSYTKASGTFSLIEARTIFGVWVTQTTPNPEGASETRLKGIACASSPSVLCMAVGYSVKEGKKTAVSMHHPIPWQLKTVPLPEGAKSSELHGVDCTASTFCMAVGSYIDSGGTEWAMSASFNGTEWTLVSVAKPSESKRSVLLDISCASSTECAGVGAYRNSKNVQVTFVERWNGTSWSHQESPNPAGSNNSVFQNVSCVKSTPCVAVGDWRNAEEKWQPMAQEWTGTKWALDTTPTPTGATFSLLEGVACRGEACLASGWYTDSEGNDKTLGESR